MLTATEFRSFTTEDFALTKDDISVLRRAEELSFYWKDNKATMTAYLPKPRGADEQPSRDIQVGYRFDGRIPDERVPMSASVHKHFLKGVSPNPCQTLVAFLRQGDLIDLQFNVDNNNGYIKGAYCKTENSGEGKLHSDMLTVIVTRGKKRYAFLISVSVSLDNSARLVRFRY